MTRAHNGTAAHSHRSRQGGKRTAISGEDEAKPKGHDAHAEKVSSMGCGLPFLAEFRLEY